MSIFFLVSMLLFGHNAIAAGKIDPAAVRPQPAVDAKALTEDIDLRLKHLQAQVTGASFFVRKIKMRENLWKIASGRGYSVHSILGCNPQMRSYDVRVNQRVLLPSRGGTLHRIQGNDTWDSIAKRYDIAKHELIACNGNVQALLTGGLIFVPGRMPDMDLMNADLREKYELRALFSSPLGGRLSSTFGKRRHPVTGNRSFHGGIDIAVPNNTWVSAAADGVVTFAGSNAGHYGTAIFIRHQNGYETHYGHLSRVRVRVGQRVKARQLIARSGSTGRSTGPHLHFTIKRNGSPIDPLKFLW